MLVTDGWGRYYSTAMWVRPRNKPRSRFLRKRGLDGPIAELERAYDDDEAVA
jgi:hypothetical protein